MKLKRKNWICNLNLNLYYKYIRYVLIYVNIVNEDVLYNNDIRVNVIVILIINVYNIVVLMNVKNKIIYVIKIMVI